MTKSQQDMIAQGYPESWSYKCPYCNSFDCHKYSDCVVCFDCRKRFLEAGVKCQI